MVGERVSAHLSVKHARGIRVLPNGAEVEDPVTLAMMMLEELLRVFSAVAIEPFDATCWVSHDNYVVCDICKVYE